MAIDSSLQPELNRCFCSPACIHKILLNLIGNALEAIDGDGTISITTQNSRFAKPVLRDQSMRVGEYVKLSVADNGEGIAPDDLEHIFDPFYSTKKIGRSGTGLGLAIVWNSVMESDGWVEAGSDAAGTRFEVFLPAAPADLPVARQHYEKADNGGGKIILLVDDEAEQIEIMQRMLSTIGYKTFGVTSSREALGFLRSCRVDVVVLDMIMENDLDGCQLYRKILEICPGQKALVISGFARSEQAAEARTLGVSRVLEKPVSLPEVSRAIRETLEDGGV